VDTARCLRCEDEASERDAATFLEHEDAGKDRGRANEISCCVGHSGSNRRKIEPLMAKQPINRLSMT